MRSWGEYISIWMWEATVTQQRRSLPQRSLIRLKWLTVKWLPRVLLGILPLITALAVWLMMARWGETPRVLRARLHCRNTESLFVEIASLSWYLNGWTKEFKKLLCKQGNGSRISIHILVTMTPWAPYVSHRTMACSRSITLMALCVLCSCAHIRRIPRGSPPLGI